LIDLLAHNEKVHLTSACVCKKDKTDPIDKTTLDSILRAISEFYETLDHKPMGVKQLNQFSSTSELKSFYSDMVNVIDMNFQYLKENQTKF